MIHLPQVMYYLGLLPSRVSQHQMLVVGVMAGISIVNLIKLEVQYSFLRLVIELVATVPSLALVAMATTGPQVHQVRPLTLATCTSVRVSCTRRLSTTVLAGIRFALPLNDLII